MKSILIATFVLINAFFFIFSINCDASTCRIGGNGNSSKQDFLDIIIDDKHAYTHLSYIDLYGFRRSLYSSLMPKGDASEKNVEGIERFPIILEHLLHDGNKNNIDLSNPITNAAVLTLKELISAFCFSIYYMLSDFFDTTDQGEIINKKPDWDQIKMQRRFYLTPEQSKNAKAIIHKSFLESSQGKMIYDIMTYNCVDYAIEIYKAAGLDKLRGDLLAQFGVYCDQLEEEDQDSAFTILKLYKAHTEGELGPARVFKVLCNAVKMLKLRDSTNEEIIKSD